MKKFILLFLILLSWQVVAEFEIKPLAYLKTVFEQQPQQKKLWLNKKTRNTVEELTGIKPPLRQRYWILGNKTAWILEAIGKTKPITLAIIIENEKVLQIKVLSFRESRGHEIQYDFFTQRYKGVALKDDGVLNRQVDGISGATLSVRAVRKMVQTALIYAHLRLEKQHG